MNQSLGRGEESWVSEGQEDLCNCCAGLGEEVRRQEFWKCTWSLLLYWPGSRTQDFWGFFIPHTVIRTLELLLFARSSQLFWEPLRWQLELVTKNPEGMLTKQHLCNTHTPVLHWTFPHPLHHHCIWAGLRREDSRFQPSVQGINILVCLLS